MDTKLHHSDISSLLAEKLSLSLSNSDIYTRTFFDLIIEGLEEDGIVKINGLGTFKMIDVASRNSVNVNTGEKFEIKGHRKITFIPADVLKDKVNQPFAMFEPVEIDDDYVDDEPDNEREYITENKELAEKELEAFSKNNDKAVTIPYDVEPIATTIDGENENMHPVLLQQHSDDNAKESNNGERDEKYEKKVVADRNIDIKIDNNSNSTDKRKSGKKSIYISILVIFISILASIAYFSDSNEDTAEVVTAVGKKDKASLLTVDDTKKKVLVQDTIAQVEQKKYSFVLIEELRSKKLSEITLADTTLYDIEGDLAIHRVGADETLVKISQIYYTDKRLWPYIVKHNSFRNYNQLEIGMNISIPKLVSSK